MPCKKKPQPKKVWWICLEGGEKYLEGKIKKFSLIRVVRVGKSYNIA